MNGCRDDRGFVLTAINRLMAGHARTAAGVVILATASAAVSSPIVPYEVQGNEIRAPLTAVAGDPARGRKVLMGRDGNCLLCHAVPETGALFMGNLGPSLSGVGARLSAGQLRLRVVDSRRLSMDTIMPAYYSIEGLANVAVAWQGKPVLTAQQVEDTVAYLRTLR